MIIFIGFLKRTEKGLSLVLLNYSFVHLLNSPIFKIYLGFLTIYLYNYLSITVFFSKANLIFKVNRLS